MTEREVQGIAKETFPDWVSLFTSFCVHPTNLRQSGKHNHQIFTQPGKVSLVIPCISCPNRKRKKKAKKQLIIEHLSRPQNFYDMLCDFWWPDKRQKVSLNGWQGRETAFTHPVPPQSDFWCIVWRSSVFATSMLQKRTMRHLARHPDSDHMRDAPSLLCCMLKFWYCSQKKIL